ncbi:hypothetical protein ACT29H_08585 [Thermophagus sp. OGC60D27]|uniref:hypothetical protein n=1 Tax=Thermophagus sp. OGC60D27 TaxID=3458415 RepID=UPI004037C7B2
MPNRLFFLFFLVVFFSISGTAQKYETLFQQWENYLQGDDNEKNFREVSLLNQIERFVVNVSEAPDSTKFLRGWEVMSDQDEKFNAFVTIVSFESGKQKLLYCLKSVKEKTAFTFTKELPFTIEEKWTLDFEMLPLNEDTIVGFNVMTNRREILKIPDVETAMGFASLMRMKGEESIFSVSEKLQQRLSMVLSQPQMFLDDFAGFSGLSTLLLPKEGVKIVTWNIEKLEGGHHFFGLLAVKDEAKNIQVYQLNDKYTEINRAQFSTLRYPDWFGAVYYQIIPVRIKKQTFFTLLGYNGNDAFSKIRIVDVFYIARQGIPVFGAPIFNVGGRVKKRLIFEYSNDANMMLRYDGREKKIVLDHLSPMDPVYEGDRSYYVPDLSYDALEYKNDQWRYLDNIELRNR